MSISAYSPCIVVAQHAQVTGVSAPLVLSMHCTPRLSPSYSIPIIVGQGFQRSLYADRTQHNQKLRQAHFWRLSGMDACPAIPLAVSSRPSARSPSASTEMSHFPGQAVDVLA